MEEELKDAVFQFEGLEFKIVELLDNLINYQMQLPNESKDMAKIEYYFGLRSRIKNKSCNFWYLE